MEFSHIHHTSSRFLNEFSENYAPVFILNTGRSGSALLHSVLNNFDEIRSYHEAPPNLFLQSNYAYHNQKEDAILTKMFEVARMELLLEAKVSNKTYVESNQCMVFYARQIRKLFRNARFVHLLRHPGDFVRSGIKKGWHRNDSVWELGRIRMKNEPAWRSLSQIEKLAWVWAETHSLIELYKTDFPDNFITLKFEELTTEYSRFKELMSFIDVSGIDSGAYEKMFADKVNKEVMNDHEPPNMHKVENYPGYSEWNDSDKNELKSWVKDLAESYEYSL